MGIDVGGLVVLVVERWSFSWVFYFYMKELFLWEVERNFMIRVRYRVGIWKILEIVEIMFS